MNRLYGCLLTPLILSVAAMAQDNAPFLAEQDALAQQARELAAEARAMKAQVDAEGWKARTLANGMALDIASKALTTGMGVSPFFQGKRRIQSDDHLYNAGVRALDTNHWDDAAKYFTEAADQKGNHAEGSLYWKAYAENKLGKRDAALATIATLRKEYSSSRWLNDAQALEVEIKQQSGKPVSPDAESNDDLKMLALQYLLHSDPEQALPLIEKLLKGNNSPKLKDKAIFVLTQSNSPKAQQLLNDVAKGTYNPDLQIKAIRQIGTSGKDSRDRLYAIYNSSTDVNVKREILRTFITSGYTGASDPLATIAKTEKHPDLRREAIRTLGITGRAETGDLLVSLYAGEQDPEIKKEILNGLFIQQNAKAIVDLARKETNPQVKQEMVQRLSNMHSKEATQYMLEILSK